mgnify:CR=1 FL=1
MQTTSSKKRSNKIDIGDLVLWKSTNGYLGLGQVVAIEMTSLHGNKIDLYKVCWFDTKTSPAAYGFETALAFKRRMQEYIKSRNKNV